MVNTTVVAPNSTLSPANLNLRGSQRDVILFCELLRTHGFAVSGKQLPNNIYGEYEYQITVVPRDGIGNQVNLYAEVKIL